MWLKLEVKMEMNHNFQHPRHIILNKTTLQLRMGRLWMPREMSILGKQIKL